MKKTTFKRVISTLFFLASFTCSFADDYIQIRPQEWSVDTVPYSFYADIHVNR
jgi:hypothetical protein